MKHSKVKSPGREELKELVIWVGGPVRLHELLVLFYQRMAKDLLIGFFFAGHDLEKIAKGQTQFILMAAGLVERFEGKGPSTAHTSLPPILQGHFDRRLVLLRETLETQKLAPELITRWLRFEESFRLVVVSEEVQHSPRTNKKGAQES